MSLSEDTLKKILNQIQTQAVTSQRSLQVVRAQIASKEKERKILQLTMRELSTVPQDGRMYRGVGKMFVQQPREEIDSTHATQEKALEEEITSLGKKAKYLEKQFEEANSQLKDIFHSQRREQ
ncbi:Prefoldin [Papiliotrema laurentii]|uniref:Prefoldin n=1 Tax=Papiliotrema laurentii TaxID=5418 RepID=A0AAD9CWJ7_PAPLA|nr:Prefoldin [Papiliotrema laurentii]